METVAQTKTCTQCKESKPATADSFYRKKTGVHGLKSACKDCESATVKAIRVNNPEVTKDRDRVYRLMNSENIPANNARWYAKNLNSNRAKSKNRTAAARAADPEKYLRQGRIRYNKDPEKFQLAARKRYAKDPDKYRSASRIASAIKTPEQKLLKSIRCSALQYGLNPDTILNHYNEHDGRCDICQRTQLDAEPNAIRLRLSIDHDHTTGDFRGLLCNSCNTGIGHLMDNVQVLRAAIDYLLKGTTHEN